MAVRFNALPFEIFKQDKDEVIMLINYFIEKGDDVTTATPIQNNKEKNDPNRRIRVNDKTATGGWW